MFVKRLVYIVLSIVFSVSVAYAAGTASPFSRYGYGEFQNPVSGSLLSMGGVGYGMRTNRSINPSNHSPERLECITAPLNVLTIL